jgi:hypothetical protein
MLNKCYNNSFISSTVPEATIDKPPEADAWYKSALEKARAIAQSMKEGGTIPSTTTTTTATISQPDVKTKVEPEVEPETEVKAEPAEQDEYGSGLAGKSEIAPGPSTSITTPSKKKQLRLRFSKMAVKILFSIGERF